MRLSRSPLLTLDSDAALMMRSLGKLTRILVVSPQVASQLETIAQIASLPVLTTDDPVDDLEWHLETEDSRKQVVRGTPRMGWSDMSTIRNASLNGLGVALLPDHVCRNALLPGRLVRVLPASRGLQGNVHFVFTIRRGLPPAVRALIDHLAAGSRATPGVNCGTRLFLSSLRQRR